MREAKKKAKDKKEEENGSQVPVVPMAGAVVIASVLGGPVCLMAGIKLGMVAALGGGIMGYTTGRLIEEHGEAESLMKGEYKDKEEDVNAQSRRVLLLENEATIQIEKLATTVLKLALMSKDADNIVKVSINQGE